MPLPSLCSPPLYVYDPPPLFVPLPSLCVLLPLSIYTPPLSLCPSTLSIYMPLPSLCVSLPLSLYTCIPFTSLCALPPFYMPLPLSMSLPFLYTPPPLSVTLSILFCVTIFNLSSVVYHLQQLFHQCLFSALFVVIALSVPFSSIHATCLSPWPLPWPLPRPLPLSPLAPPPLSS